MAIYKNLGVEFDYPENWEVTDEMTEGWPRQVSLQTPEGGFWLLQVFSGDNPTDLTAAVLKTMRDEYQEVEAEAVTEQVEEIDAVGFDMNFYCLDLLVTAKVRGLRLGELTLLILSQAEDRDFDRLEMVFHAILISLLRRQPIARYKGR